MCIANRWLGKEEVLIGYKGESTCEKGNQHRNKEEDNVKGDVVTLYGAKQREFSFQGAVRRYWWSHGRVQSNIHKDKFLLQYFAQAHPTAIGQ